MTRRTRHRHSAASVGPPRPGRIRRALRVYRYLPTCLTIGNSLCGFGAILYTLHVYEPQRGTDDSTILATSAWLVVGAMFFDLLDGWTARVLNAMSLHGMQMDSLADMVTFGVAPAVMVSVMAHVGDLAWLTRDLVWVLCAGYLACVALRLALYNVRALEKTDGGGGFHGLPSPGAAAAVCSVIILYQENTFTFAIFTQLLPLYAGLLGILMVSPIPYPHLGKWLGGRRYRHLKLLGLIIFFVFFHAWPQMVAAIAINGYVLYGPVMAVIHWALDRDHDGDEGDEGNEPPDDDDDMSDETAGSFI